ncbi:acetylajmalan esterase-like [Diospyros lotus]|uniref:acetylajmalan esterase-like n=1 Tax=Diospyros lotus TaxID=55363 RepID=UPI00225BB14F|nr:acetylajmalan esterase-like [Diospyros lotus]
MAAKRMLFPLLLPLCSFFFFLLSHPCNAHHLKICHFDQIYQLGDSISDTGNLIREPIGAATPFAKLPYGETFFNSATGRCSNGRLMIDYITEAAGLPLLNPYKNDEADFRHGVNFAVAGSTALPVENLASKKIVSPVTTSSLNVQLNWMFSHFNSTCHTERDCLEKLKDSLFMVGEIGGNDYNYALLQGKSIEQVTTDLVPEVVQEIARAVRGVISYGAVRVVVPGNFPIGCLPIYLTAFETNATAAYDGNHCLKQLNSFASYHNNLLRETIKELKKEFPNVVIVYGDYYHTYKWLLKNVVALGFDPMSTQKSCCGTGGNYNFNLNKMCGQDVSVCSNPNQYISWDGIHSTQQAYRIMAERLLQKIFPQLHCRI